MSTSLRLGQNCFTGAATPSWVPVAAAEAVTIALVMVVTTANASARVDRDPVRPNAPGCGQALKCESLTLDPCAGVRAQTQ
jgi:hypothetical protein